MSARTKYVLRPLVPSHKSFRNAPLTSNALGNRLHDHLVVAGLYEGDACHSFRRGSLQAAHARGATREELKAKAQIATESVLDLYLDRTAHLTGRNTRRRA
ncbi:hypothetical protein GPECTOR_1g448 [Gonium pectorale]|uniref:Tyr recombinase domain-containing protein n=1 Tax=Gonium pectorale TaxID=33097 RepID=A0A150H4J4_GONPE|nr:hypothetical protein GPECTOR_1g448 [Gonium pectorale]|eukprot:KXZ56500.1 hypothetical protein GPECTOR_1g448 [Gonium pectorale]